MNSRIGRASANCAAIDGYRARKRSHAGAPSDSRNSCASESSRRCRHWSHRCQSAAPTSTRRRTRDAAPHHRSDTVRRVAVRCAACAKFGHVVAARDVREVRIERLSRRISVESLLWNVQRATEKPARTAGVDDEAGAHPNGRAAPRAAQRGAPSACHSTPSSVTSSRYSTPSAIASRTRK